MKIAAFILLGLVTTGGQTASGQSLGQLAQQEKERRALKKQSLDRSGKTVKVYTQNDVRTAVSAEDAEVAEGESGKERAVAVDTGASEAAAPDLQEAQRLQWRSRADAVLAELAAAETDVRAMEALGPGLTVPPNGLIQARARLASARKRLDDLEEDARRVGVPPGWVR